MACAGCASLGDDVVLAPLYARHSRAGGGVEVEALAGAVRVRRPGPIEAVSDWAVRPFLSHWEDPGSDSHSLFLVPLGTRTVRGDESVLQVLPLVRYERSRGEHGTPQWKLMALPGILWSKDESGRVVRAFFPFGGVVERFLTFDRVTFVLFPLYVKTERAGRTSWHFLFPIFAYSTTPAAKPSYRVFPLFGVSRSASYDRRFFLWPFVQIQRDNLRAAPDRRRTRWMVFPLYGRDAVGHYDAWTVLWPFFGYARDTRSGFWSWDGPWPFVRIQRPGTSAEVAYRTRVWPFYSYFRDAGLESTWSPWPLYNRRVERYPDGERRAEYSFPFWQHWTKTDPDGARRADWLKLWPLYQRYVEGEHERVAWPALNPLWHLPQIDFHYAWIYELYAREREGERTSERAWGGIWKRERDAREVREYLSVLWSRRRYRAAGERISETSLLFGLVRWRWREKGEVELLAPALPGPGWPAFRHD
jgi:hypothetical protein